MAKINEKACKSCHGLTKDDVCPRCTGPLSNDWQGLVLIIEPDRSEIASKMNIADRGKFALKVR